MPTVIHTHLILITDELVEADVWATYLALESRGRHIVAGDRCREQRDRLAAEMPAGGMLAELLASDRPILVDGIAGGYRVEELPGPI